MTYPTNNPANIETKINMLIGINPENISKNTRTINPVLTLFILKYPARAKIANMANAAKYVASPANTFIAHVCNSKGSIQAILI